MQTIMTFGVGIGAGWGTYQTNLFTLHENLNCFSHNLFLFVSILKIYLGSAFGAVTTKQKSDEENWSFIR